MNLSLRLALSGGIAPLLVAACGPAGLPNGKTRSGLIAAMQLVLKTNDQDHDGRLSQGEVRFMVDRGMAPIFKTGQNKSQLEEARLGL